MHHTSYSCLYACCDSKSVPRHLMFDFWHPSLTVKYPKSVLECCLWHQQHSSSPQCVFEIQVALISGASFCDFDYLSSAHTQLHIRSEGGWRKVLTRYRRLVAKVTCGANLDKKYELNTHLLTQSYFGDWIKTILTVIHMQEYTYSSIYKH